MTTPSAIAIPPPALRSASAPGQDSPPTHTHVPTLSGDTHVRATLHREIIDPLTPASANSSHFHDCTEPIADSSRALRIDTSAARLHCDTLPPMSPLTPLSSGSSGVPLANFDVPRCREASPKCSWHAGQAEQSLSRWIHAHSSQYQSPTEYRHGLAERNLLAAYVAEKCATVKNLDGRAFVSIRDDVIFLETLSRYCNASTEGEAYTMRGALQHACLTLQHFLRMKSLDIGERAKEIQQCVSRPTSL